MKFENYIVLSRNEVHERIPYAVIAETMGGSRWNTGRRKRMFNEWFSESEKAKVRRLYTIARDWYLIHGVPDEVKLLITDLGLFEKLGAFCASL